MNREQILATAPSYYNPTIHKLLPLLIGGVVIGSCLTAIQFSWLTPFIIIGTLFVSLGAEHQIHARILHKPLLFLKSLCEKHLLHHQLYTNQDMAMKSPIEAHFILMPTYAILALLGAFLPWVGVVLALFGSSPAATVLATLMVFALSYEWLHYSYHMPADTWVGRSKIISWLREHHRSHHNPKLMQRWNFNVTVPVFDWILGTKNE